jgi:hypothetical protein
VAALSGVSGLPYAHGMTLPFSEAVVDYGGFMLENWRNSDPVFFTQVGRMGHRPIVATKGGLRRPAGMGRAWAKMQR